MSSSARSSSKHSLKGSWECDVENRIIQYPDSAEYFLDELLPTSTPFTLEDDVDDAFKLYEPEERMEVDGYQTLLSGLRMLVKHFESDRKPSFGDIHGTPMSFPFDAYKDQNQCTRPDLVVSFPGQPLPRTPDWQAISMVIEVQPYASDDPFACDVVVPCTVVQLAQNARSLMLANGFLFAFTIGIYGSVVRLARFDRTCAIVSPPIDIKETGGPRLLQRFLWHFSHPVVGGTVVGCDPTVARLDGDGQAWVRRQLAKAKPKNWEKHLRELDKARRVEVYDQKTGRSVPYILYHLLDVDEHVFCRATTVWRALEDTRVWKDGRLVDDPMRTARVKPQVLKDTWRPLTYQSEIDFYQRIEEKIPREERYGLPTMVCGGDMGSREFRLWEETCRRRSTDTGHSGMANAASRKASSLSGESSGSDALASEDFPLPFPQQQTYSYRLLYGDEYAYMGLSHVRIVVDDVGRPITRFASTREMVQAIRDAILGHQQARERAQVLHRDVSVGNILIVDEPKEKRFCGFLHDYDCSSIKLKGAEEGDGHETAPAPASSSQTAVQGEGSRRKERMGTPYFMAIELLAGGVSNSAEHQTHHDLESFYWVLIWIVLRHTNHDHFKGQHACEELFERGHGAREKYVWVLEQQLRPLAVHDNAPLTQLLRDLAMLMCLNTPNPMLYATVHLTYDRLLRQFDAALARTDWPEGDDALHCELDCHPVTRAANQPKLAADVPGSRPHLSGGPREDITMDGTYVHSLSSQGGAASATGVALEGSAAQALGSTTRPPSAAAPVNLADALSVPDTQPPPSLKRPRSEEDDLPPSTDQDSRCNKRLKSSGQAETGTMLHPMSPGRAWHER
ncbi:hypothetical protein BV20DRAFT_750961 [Pilatotrama ljubarskyi]|nr:hypothetical protein BV20DRAFT_750961 [Pilatotrama ljubarskyi]